MSVIEEVQRTVWVVRCQVCGSWVAEHHSRKEAEEFVAEAKSQDGGVGCLDHDFQPRATLPDTRPGNWADIFPTVSARRGGVQFNSPAAPQERSD